MSIDRPAGHARRRSAKASTWCCTANGSVDRIATARRETWGPRPPPRRRFGCLESALRPGYTRSVGLQPDRDDRFHGRSRHRRAALPRPRSATLVRAPRGASSAGSRVAVGRPRAAGGAGHLQPARPVARHRDDARPPRTSPGPAGAVVADLLLQFFGVAGALPGLALLAWGWRIGSHRPLRPGLRLAALMLALPVIAALLAGLPRPAGLADTRPGAGGAVGAADRRCRCSRPARGVLGPLGALLAGVVGAHGGDRAHPADARPLRRRVARGRARATIGAARRSCDQGRRTAGFFSRTARGIGAALGARAALRRPFDRPDAGAAPGRVRRSATRDQAAGRAAALADPRRAADGRRRGGTSRRRRTPRRRGPHGRARAAGARQGLRAPRASRAAAAGEPAAGRRRLAACRRSRCSSPPPPRAGHRAPTEEALQANARLLETVLDDYGVQGHDPRDPPRPGGHALRAGAGARHPQRPRDRPRRRRGAQPLGHRRAHRHRARPQRDRHRGAEREARDRLPLRAARQRGMGSSNPGQLALALGKDISGAPGDRRPRAHAASADRRHHRLGQVGRHQRDDPVAALPAVARPVPAHHDRPQDAGALRL